MNKTPLEIAALALGVIIIIGISANLNGNYNGLVQGIQTATSSVFGGTSHPHPDREQFHNHNHIAARSITLVNEYGDNVKEFTVYPTSSNYVTPQIPGYVYENNKGDSGYRMHINQNELMSQHMITLKVVHIENKRGIDNIINY